MWPNNPPSPLPTYKLMAITKSCRTMVSAFRYSLINSFVKQLKRRVKLMLQRQQIQQLCRTLHRSRRIGPRSTRLTTMLPLSKASKTLLRKSAKTWTRSKWRSCSFRSRLRTSETGWTCSKSKSAGIGLMSAPPKTKYRATRTRSGPPIKTCPT